MFPFSKNSILVVSNLNCSAIETFGINKKNIINIKIYFSFTLIKPIVANMEINNKGKKIDNIIGIFPLFPSDENMKFM